MKPSPINLLSAMLLPTEDQLKRDYIEWFRSQFGIPPVVTSSTGMPAVHFALHILKRYHKQEGNEG
jgi:hypothetical protein